MVRNLEAVSRLLDFSRFELSAMDMKRMVFVVPRNYRLSVLLVISLALLGCVGVPLPWKSTDARINDDQVKAFLVGVTTRSDVQSALGMPDLTRRNNQLWIYGWNRGHGKFAGLVAAPFSPYGAAPFYRPLYYMHYALFLDFSGTGTLIGMDLIEGEDNICRKDGLCVQHWDEARSYNQETFSLESVEKLEESVTVVIASDDEDKRAKHFAANMDACGVYLTGDEIRFSLGSVKQEPLYKEIYTFLELMPGKKAILFRSQSTSTREEFECRPGEIVYLDALVKWPLFSSAPQWTISLERSVRPPKEIEGKRLQLLDEPLTNVPQEIYIQDRDLQMELQYQEYLSRAPQDMTRLPYLCRAAEGGNLNAQIEVGRHYAQGIEGFPQDRRRAFVWYSLAGRDGSDMHLQLLTQQMNADEIAESRQLLADWKPGLCAHDLMPGASGN